MRAGPVVHADFVHWFLLAPIALLGVRVIPTIHCRLWNGVRPSRGTGALLLRLNGWYFRRFATGVICVPEEIAKQIREIAGDETRVLTFSPSYERELFDGPPAKPSGRRRILYAGRVERSKGVLDLVDMAARLREMGREDVAFDVCGDGGALSEMQVRAREKNVDDLFSFHGHVERTRLAVLLRSSFAVIAPTRSEFAEGFNKSIAEGVLAQLPVITSPVCPAALYFGSAVVSVPPDQTAGYVGAILRLVDDPAFYESVVRKGENLREPFFSPAVSWAARLRTCLASAVPSFVSDAAPAIVDDLIRRPRREELNPARPRRRETATSP